MRSLKSIFVCTGNSQTECCCPDKLLVKRNNHTNKKESNDLNQYGVYYLWCPKAQFYEWNYHMAHRHTEH